MPHIGYSGRSPCYSVAVRPHVHMAYGAPEVSDAEAPIARVLAWAITNGAGPQREGLRALRNLPGALSSALERGSASKSRMVSLYTSTCATEHSAAVTTHTTLWRKCGHEGSVADPRGIADYSNAEGERRAPNHRDDDLAVILLLARFAYLRTERTACRPSTAAAGLRTDSRVLPVGHNSL